MCYDGVYSHEYAHHKKKKRTEKAVPDGDGRQVPRAQIARHHRINETHGHLQKLRRNNGRPDPQGLAGLAQNLVKLAVNGTSGNSLLAMTEHELSPIRSRRPRRITDSLKTDGDFATCLILLGTSVWCTD